MCITVSPKLLASSLLFQCVTDKALECHNEGKESTCSVSKNWEISKVTTLI